MGAARDRLTGLFNSKLIVLFIKVDDISGV